MKIFITLLFLWSSTVMAQVYKSELDGDYLPAKITLKDGTTNDVILQYRQPEYFKNPHHKFSVIYPNDNSISRTLQDQIEAFTIDNNIWAMRVVNGVNQFVVLHNQGAIEEIEYIINGKIGEVTTGAYFVTGERSKVITRNMARNETVEGRATDEKIKQWISDSPEVVEDWSAAEKQAAEAKEAMTVGSDNAPAPKKGLMAALEKASEKETVAKEQAATRVDMARIINNYNSWYEKRNPGKIKYHFISNPEWINLPKREKTKAELEAERLAEIDKVYGSRSTTVSPELASAKDNLPVKKEKFGAKISRIKSDGNRIGVLLSVLPARAEPPLEGSTISQNLPIDGEYLDESLRDAGQQVVDELNQVYNTTVFELIDLNKIPYRVVKVLGQESRIDDWWATKYKVVFTYSIEPRLQLRSGLKEKYSASLYMIQSLIATEFIGPATSLKRDILTQVLNFGSFNVPAIEQQEEIKDAKEIYQKAVSSLNAPMLDKIKTERADGITKVAKKLSLE